MQDISFSDRSAGVLILRCGVDDDGGSSTGQEALVPQSRDLERFTTGRFDEAPVICVDVGRKTYLRHFL